MSCRDIFTGCFSLMKAAGFIDFKLVEHYGKVSDRRHGWRPSYCSYTFDQINLIILVRLFVADDTGFKLTVGLDII